MPTEIDDALDAHLSFWVTAVSGGRHSITLPGSTLVRDLKAILATTKFENVAVDKQRLIFSGQTMLDDKALSLYEVKTGNTIYMIKCPATSVYPSSLTPTAMAPMVPALSTTTIADFPLTPLIRDSGFPLSEEQIDAIMLQPAMAQALDESLRDPEFAEYLFRFNPQLTEIPNFREFIQSPSFRYMMTDPNAIRARALWRAVGADLDWGILPHGTADASTLSEGADSMSPAAGLLESAVDTDTADRSLPTSVTPAQSDGTPNYGYAQILQQMALSFSEITLQILSDTQQRKEQYGEQLRRLDEMGFQDVDRNIEALRRNDGSLQGALEDLILEAQGE